MSKTKMTLVKLNYQLIIIGCIIVVLGFILMAGGGSENPNEFNEEELFSFRRITLAPFCVIVGYMVVLYGVMKRPKITEDETPEINN